MPPPLPLYVINLLITPPPKTANVPPPSLKFPHMKTKTPTKPRKSTQMKTKAAKRPAVTREDGRVTINAEVIDNIFTETIANLMALQVVWEKISLKDEIK